MGQRFDVMIIGGGVVGCAVARFLSRFRGSFCLVEREQDVCCGTSKANSAIIHAGFDAKAGTLMAKYNVLGSRMMPELARELDRQVLPDAMSCMNAALEGMELPYPRVQNQLDRMGQSLGRFDLSGQLQGLSAVKDSVNEELRRLREGRDIRLRSYRCLCLCAGAALVILLL